MQGTFNVPCVGEGLIASNVELTGESTRFNLRECTFYPGEETAINELQFQESSNDGNSSGYTGKRDIYLSLIDRLHHCAPRNK